jgi:putative thiamine transport system permease protein
VSAAAAALLLGVPVAAALFFAAGDAFDRAAWAALLADSQLPRALAATVWIGAVSTVLALAAALAITTRWHGGRTWARLERRLGAALALPHVAFAIGLALLVAPSGWIARLFAPLAGWSAPPPIDTLHEPFGAALIAALVLKETPFLLWAIAAQLARSGQSAELLRQVQVAEGFGYPRAAAWWRIVWPQLLPRLGWPLLAVWAYGLTVVDVAIVLGPERPPTLARLAWQWLLDADPARNAQGSAAAWLLAALVAAGALLAIVIGRALRAAVRRRAIRGLRPADGVPPLTTWLHGSGIVLYALVIAALVFASFATVWTFPALPPQQLSASAWVAVGRASGTIGLSFGLGLAAALGALAVALAWLEATPPSWDRRAALLIFAPLVLPGILLVAGLYRVALELGVDATLPGLWLAHLVFCAPYALLALAPAYRGFDARYAQAAAGLGRGRAAFLLRIKWPMLAGPIGAAAAVAFAVSIAQYLPTQFVGAGRFASITTEAVTLASGGQRDLAAAFALLQAAGPALGFALAAAWIARRRRLDA